MHDDPTEQVQEDIHHHATHGDEHDEHGHGGGHGGHHGPGWITAAALTAALLAALAAITASLANSHLTDSTLSRISALDRWNQYQSKSIKSSVVDTRLMEFGALTNDPNAKVPDVVARQHKDDLAKKKEYNTPASEDDPDDPKGMKGLQAKAKELDTLSKDHLESHESYELSETLFHISIAVVAIAVVARRKEFWYVSMVGGMVGLVFFGWAMYHAPFEKPEKPEPAAVSTEKPGGEKKTGAENKKAGEPGPQGNGGSAEHAG